MFTYIYILLISPIMVFFIEVTNIEVTWLMMLSVWTAFLDILGSMNNNTERPLERSLSLGCQPCPDLCM